MTEITKQQADDAILSIMMSFYIGDKRIKDGQIINTYIAHLEQRVDDLKDNVISARMKVANCIGLLGMHPSGDARVLPQLKDALVDLCATFPKAALAPEPEKENGK